MLWLCNDDKGKRYNNSFAIEMKVCVTEAAKLGWLTIFLKALKSSLTLFLLCIYVESQLC